MGKAANEEAPQRPTMGVEKEPLPISTELASSTDQSPSHDKQRRWPNARRGGRGGQGKGQSDGRGRDDRRDKRKDMGRGEWRYAELRPC